MVQGNLNYTQLLEMPIPNGCFDAYEVKVNKDIFKYQETVKLTYLFQRFLKIFNGLLEFASFPSNNCKKYFEVFTSIRNVNPMQREFGDPKLSPQWI